MKIILNDAGNGDCILIQNNSTNILIDGGTADSFSNWYDTIKNLESLDAIFITHIDDDHVNGIIKLIEKNNSLEKKININKFFFNGIEQILELKTELDNEYNDDFDAISSCFSKINDENIGFSEGTSLSYLLKDNQINSLSNGKIIHNKTFSEPFDIGDISIEIIGPNLSSLLELKESWLQILRERGIKKRILSKKHVNAFECYVNTLNDEISLSENISSEIFESVEQLANTTYKADLSLSNKCSFSFLIKSDTKSILMLGDTHTETVINWLNEKDIHLLDIDAVKVSHHGSKKNISKELIERLNCNKYLISTNGQIFGHPDFETLARIAMFSTKADTTIYINNYIEHISEEFIEKLEKFKNKTIVLMNIKEVLL